jgi:hypothetical protein
VPVERELFDFFDKILGQTEGILRIATRDSEERFKTTLFAWPERADRVIRLVNDSVAENKEVYFSPDLFTTEAMRQKKFTKDLVKGSSVICLDFDGNAPQDDAWYGEHDLPLPSIRVQTSSVGNQHVYWKLSEFVEDVDRLENMRRTLTYTVKSDPSGWDAGQLLRVPYTTNYKYGKPDDHTYDVFIEEDSADRVYPTGTFHTTEDFRPLVGSLIDRDSLPDLSDVLMDNTFVPGFKEIFKKMPDPNTRSDALMRVAYDAAESDLSNEQIYVLLVDADDRWGKYKHRKDRHLRYFDIIERAKAKYPHGPIEISITDEIDTDYQRVYDYDELMSADIHIEWFFEGLLSTQGYGILAGQPNIGKTQIAIRLSVACALQLDFLGWKNRSTRPMTVLFYSLEMAAPQIQHFFNQMTDLEDHRTELKEHLKVAPIAGLLDFTSEKMLKTVQADIDRYHPDIIIIDSLSMAVSESLNDSKTAMNFNAVIKSIRKNAKCAVVTIHHSKKSQTNKSMVGDLDDLYGSRFITAEADFVITFIPTFDNDDSDFDKDPMKAITKQSTDKPATGIKAINSKIRLGPWVPSIDLVRTPTLDFEERDAALSGLSQGKHSSRSSSEVGFEFPDSN